MAEKENRRSETERVQKRDPGSGRGSTGQVIYIAEWVARRSFVLFSPKPALVEGAIRVLACRWAYESVGIPHRERFTASLAALDQRKPEKPLERKSSVVPFRPTEMN